MKRALLIVIALAGSAQANIWKDVVSPPDASQDTYDKELREGDDHVLLANSHSSSLTERRRQVMLAITSYKLAAAAKPAAAEPWFRIAETFNQFFLTNCVNQPHFGMTPSPFKDCSRPDAIDANIAAKVIEAWGEAEKRAPLDPRFSGNDGDSILFERAILNTKLGTPASLLAATKDYEAYLARSDGKGANVETTWSNLAETYMMLGRLDDSIEAYREIGTPSSVSTIYGAAVALDRAERTPLALDLIRGQHVSGYESFKRSVNLNHTFFVPQGEQFYYYALVEEAFGNVAQSIYYWRAYLSSEAGTRKTGAHPKFQARAKQHLDALVKKRGKAGPPLDPFLDMR